MYELPYTKICLNANIISTFIMSNSSPLHNAIIQQILIWYAKKNILNYSFSNIENKTLTLLLPTSGSLCKMPYCAQFVVHNWKIEHDGQENHPSSAKYRRKSRKIQKTQKWNYQVHMHLLQAEGQRWITVYLLHSYAKCLNSKSSFWNCYKMLACSTQKSAQHFSIPTPVQKLGPDYLSSNWHEMLNIIAIASARWIKLGGLLNFCQILSTTRSV